MSGLEPSELARLADEVAAVHRRPGVEPREALAAAARRAASVSVLLALGIAGLVASWIAGFGVGQLPPGDPDPRILAIGLVLASAWCGYRIAEWRVLRRLERLAAEDPQ